MYKTLIQTLLACFYAILAASPLEGGGVMIAARQIAFGRGAEKKEELPAYWGLCFTAEEAGSTVAMQAVGSAPAVTLETSYDGEIWEPFTVGETTITLTSVGDKVYFRAGEGGNTALGAYALSDYNNFVIAGKIAASGNTMSLLQGDVTTYTLARYCFSNLFSNCKSLTSAPELPATTLASFCYYRMFYKCSSIATAPELPTETHSAEARGPYNLMFTDCTNLSKIKVRLTTSLTAATAGKWVENVSPTGTFICPTALGTNETIKRGIGGCPQGWTVINED